MNYDHAFSHDCLRADPVALRIMPPIIVLRPLGPRITTVSKNGLRGSWLDGQPPLDWLEME